MDKDKYNTCIVYTSYMNVDNGYVNLCQEIWKQSFENISGKCAAVLYFWLPPPPLGRDGNSSCLHKIDFLIASQGFQGLSGDGKKIENIENFARGGEGGGCFCCSLRTVFSQTHEDLILYERSKETLMKRKSLWGFQCSVWYIMLFSVHMRVVSFTNIYIICTSL
jgi:hypothetical protein